MASNFDKFNPAGAVQVNALISGPQIQKNQIDKLNGQYSKGTVPRGPQLGSSPVLQQQPVQQSAMFGSPAAGAQTPKGAQPIPIAGAPQLGAAAPKLPMSPQAQKAPEGSQVHLIKVELEGPNGSKFVGEYELQAPRGSKVLGVTESIIG